ncbi:MAG: low-specificity L-threonine aldolase [Myxococcales bacterium]|nr:low-specificity L-threonine aldolase [Myxococcales bacterium]
MSHAVVDLRSDTVTRPTSAMRDAMAHAEVGDDVYGEDPTVNRLQATVADLLGVEAALYVPSGSMANQIAIKIHTQPGDDVLIGEGSHNWLYESGAAAVISGVQFTICGEGGLYDADQLHAAIKPDNHHFAPTRLACVENTHNRGGGRIWPRAQVAALLEAAATHRLATHLDGARLWNASAATGVPVDELARGFGTVSVCLSKGLGAPVGSLLCGPRDLIHRAHRMRKLLGGGMRQAGILAAAGLHALAHHRTRLVEDHANARHLAERLATGLHVDLASVESNIVLADLPDGAPGADELVTRARARGVLVNAIGPRRIRLVTHLDVDRTACERGADELLAACG